MSVQCMGCGICFYDIKSYVDRVCDICRAVYDSVKYYFCGINEIFSRKDGCYMTFFMNMILNMFANAAEGAAIFSVGTASLGGMYEPVMPDELKE